MDYKEEYQKAFERAKKGMPIDEVFPELKESEDEKIRKEIISCIKSHVLPGGLLIREGEFYREDAITYLEKQKEQKPIEHLELKAGHWYICHRAYCCRADHLTVKEGERFQCEKDGIVKGFVVREPEKYFIEVSAPAPMEDEQHPAEWSEEDNKKIGRLRSIVNDCAFRNDALDVNGDYCEGDYGELDNWLKSLKNRGNSQKSNTNSPSWKPSEEQIYYLAKAIKTLGEEGDCKTANILNELLNDLKHYNYEIQKA